MKVVEREDWHAKPPKNEPTELDLNLLEGVALHYTASNWDEASHSYCDERILAIQKQHMTTDQLAPGGANDIAYSWLVCRHGYCFEGRGWGIRTAAQGSALGNDRYHAICVLGNDDPGVDDVKPAGRLALMQLIAVAFEGFPKARQLRPHSVFADTECPGAELKAWALKFAGLVQA